MDTYHKIDSVYKRDEKGKFIFGEYSKPEFSYLADKPWIWTEKIDGTNIRVHWNPANAEVSFGGRTDNAQIPVKLIKHLRDTFHEDRFLDACLDTPMTLYGEGYGAGIQSGGNYSPEQKFILFDVKIGNFWLERENVADIADKLHLDIVDVIGTFSLETVVGYARAFKSIKSSMFPNANMEGYVGTPAVPLFNRKGERIITKVKFRDFDEG